MRAAAAPAPSSSSSSSTTSTSSSSPRSRESARDLCGAAPRVGSHPHDERAEHFRVIDHSLAETGRARVLSGDTTLDEVGRVLEGQV